MLTSAMGILLDRSSPLTDGHLAAYLDTRPCYTSDIDVDEALERVWFDTEYDEEQVLLHEYTKRTYRDEVA